MKFFRVMLRLYGKESVRINLSVTDTHFRYPNSAATLVHKAVESGYLKLVNEVLIDEIGFETDFYTPHAK